LNNPLTPSLYLPIEESERELTAKLLVAAVAATRGLAAIVGQVWLLNENLDHLPRGIVVFKGNNSIQHDNMRLAKRAGHLVASIEEEALGVARADQILRLYDAGIDRVCDRFFAQGAFHRQTLIGRMPDAADRILVVGNPRVDLLRPSFLAGSFAERDAIRDAHGRFVLINTNYSGANSILGDALATYESCIGTNFFRHDSAEDDQAFRDLLAWERGNIREIARLVRWFETNSDGFSLVIRPHPAERFETWADAFAERPRVRVVRTGGHLPWTLASAVLMHAGCTTGMEAFVAHHPAIALKPGDNPWHSCFLSNQVNPTFGNAADAARFALACMADPARIEDLRAAFLDVLRFHVEAIDGALAAERLVAAICAMLPAAAPAGAVPWQPLPGFRPTRPATASQRHKMSVTFDDARRRLDQVARAVPALARVQLREIGQSVFQVSA
jgi:surface carbohydrate biosynthesis protein